MKKRVPLIDRTGTTPKTVGWAEVDDQGNIIGEMKVEDPEFSRRMVGNMGGSFSIAPAVDGACKDCNH